MDRLKPYFENKLKYCRNRYIGEIFVDCCDVIVPKDVDNVDKLYISVAYMEGFKY